MLGQLPAESRVSVVYDGVARNPTDVRRDWRKFEFLGSDARASGGWGAQTLNCVKTIHAESGTRIFTLQDFYSRFEAELIALNPDNHNIRAKIRQQLQVLRDGGVITFLGSGRYRLAD